MRIEHIILLIIAFNVVSALVQRSRKKKRAEQASQGAARPGRPSPDHADPEWEPEDEDEEWEHGSRPRREDDRPVTEMPSLGRDILDQIARDLGLKTPKPGPAQPEKPARRVPERPAAPASRRASESVVARRSAERPSSAPAPDRSAFEQPYTPPEYRPEYKSGYSRPGAASTPKRPGGDSTPVRKAPESLRTPLVNLHEPGKLREAFVLKEILGAPVSRRR